MAVSDLPLVKLKFL